MAKRESRDIFVRLRFTMICFGILWAFWGLLRLGEWQQDRNYLVWSAPDPGATALLMRMSCQNSTFDDPGPGH